ncbi:MAG: fumarylacetoacetate hydrolase family protein [Pseudomonadota bacterium]|jgi:5-oxopent-3-ene-1,2,5-tricarboxylate decarboxylase/2-hydroxyhepta-2,4-diene-1,7-dioate isomerase
MLATSVLLNPLVLPGLPLALARLGLSGTVYGVLANDPALVQALGDAVNQPPYKAPPLAPVLFIKPRNTLAAAGSHTHLPAGEDAYALDAHLGLVIGRTACRVGPAQALDHLAGYLAVADLSVPHASYYRPGLRSKARDGSCLLGPAVTPPAAVNNPDALAVRVSVDGQGAQAASTAGRVRGVAQLLADVTAFMTLRPGDVLLLGASRGAPRVRAGQSWRIEIEGLPALEGAVTAATTIREAAA